MSKLIILNGMTKLYINNKKDKNLNVEDTSIAKYFNQIGERAIIRE